MAVHLCKSKTASSRMFWCFFIGQFGCFARESPPFHRRMGEIAQSIRMGWRAAATAFRTPVRVAAGRHA
jgi:hypothetical protein